MVARYHVWRIANQLYPLRGKDVLYNKAWKFFRDQKILLYYDNEAEIEYRVQDDVPCLAITVKSNNNAAIFIFIDGTEPDVCIIRDGVVENPQSWTDSQESVKELFG